MSNKKQKTSSGTIAKNRTAHFNYQINESIEAGIVLEGWEVKSLRSGSANISEAYVFIRNGEAFISGMSIETYKEAASHIVCEPKRVRKLLLKKNDIEKLSVLVDRKGMTLVATSLYWSKSWAKLNIGFAKGKNNYDKRMTEKDRDWNINKSRLEKSFR